jgi:hypothetical protein
VKVFERTFLQKLLHRGRGLEELEKCAVEALVICGGA